MTFSKSSIPFEAETEGVADDLTITKDNKNRISNFFVFFISIYILFEIFL